MNPTIRNIPINPNLAPERLRDLIRRARSVRQCAVAEEWLMANRAIRPEESAELARELTQRIRDAFRRETEQYNET